MAGACSCKSCCLGGLRKRLEGFRPVPEKQMAGACSCKSCCLGGLRKRLEGFQAGQTAVLNSLKNRWQGHVAVRVVALEACGSVWGFEAGQTAVLNPLKNRWQGHVGVRVRQEHVDGWGM